MKQNSVIHMGFDDTDSPNAMCTTFLAYKIVNYLKKEMVEFLDYPYLIRFNPNIPWKTRGNGAVALSIRTNNPEKIKKKVKELVKKYSDTKGGANPGLVFFEKNKIPNNFSEFSKLALWRLVNRNHAKRFAVKNQLDTLSLGNGQGLVGAIGAIGYKFHDHTFELLSYRKKSQIGKKRKINKESVRQMQEKTYPITFNSFDHKKNRVMITPRGPDPVFYGLRGEKINSLLDASKMIQTKERLHGYMAFKTNQGTIYIRYNHWNYFKKTRNATRRSCYFFLI
jgi:tRNA(Ile2)-agmatinylcytidine synthase